LSLNFCILASGSSGNCSVIWTEKAVILVDCGCSARYITENLAGLNIAPENLTAAVITHVHTDHISTSGFSFLLKNNIPIYLHKDIFEDLSRKYGKKAAKCINIYFNKTFKVKDIVADSFNVYHKDAHISRTLGFTFSSIVNIRKYKIGYVTDTGKICSKIIKSLVNSNILVIESNYNRTMLNSSSRPYDNKKWILSDWGHLSNENAASAIAEIKKLSTDKESLKYVFLAHISNHHNTSEVAINTTRRILIREGISDINLLISKRERRSSAIRIS
jgi:phosphoribosyl 1,2-cyclic phosphodiesterase